MTTHPHPLRQHQEEIDAGLRAAFLQNVAANRQIMADTDQAAPVAARIFDLSVRYLADEADESDVTALATDLARRGLAPVTGRELVKVFSRITCRTAEQAATVRQRLTDFQLIFVEGLATTRESLLQVSQQQEQKTLRNALRNQLEQQRHLQSEQERRTHNLQRILQLNATLTGLSGEQNLLDTAVSGICRHLDLADVTVYERQQDRWTIRTTTAASLTPGGPLPAGVEALLDQTLNGDGEVVTTYRSNGGAPATRIAIGLHTTQDRLRGAIVANARNEDADVPLLVRTFAQNLDALWQNLDLYLETKQRARELEIAHGRYLDSVWQTETAGIHARHSPAGLEIERTDTPRFTDRQGKNIPLLIGEHPLGNVTLPAGVALSEDDSDFVQALIREMGNALNNARLLQTARAYSHQLRAAADVSRAASTILDREQLMAEAVQLIRSRFHYYYAGLFLVEGEAVVQTAGNGPAGPMPGDGRISAGKQSVVGRAIRDNRPCVERDAARAGRNRPDLPDTRSELALPLRTRGTTIGALNVHSTRPGVFTDEEITVLQTLADQIAVATENADLFSQVQDTSVRANRLYQAGRRIIEADAPADVYQALIDFVATTGLFDLAFIMRPDPHSAEYFLAANLWSRIGVEPNPEEDRIRRDLFPFAENATGQNLLVVADGQTDERLDPRTRALFVQNGVRAAVFIPIYAEGQWQGTLVMNRVEAAPPGREDLQPFRTLCDQAAVALANQQLLRETSSLYQVSRALNQALTAEDALSATVEQVVQYTRVPQSHMVLYDLQDGQGRIAAEQSPSGRAGDFRLSMWEDGLYEHLSLSRAPLLVTAGEDDSFPSAQRYLDHFDLAAALLVPAASQQELLGFLTLVSRRGTRQFTQTNVNFAQNAVAQLTTFLENITLFDEALERAQELITLNQIGARISGVLDLDNLLDVIYQEVGHLLEANVFLLAEYDDEDGICTPLLTMVDDAAVDAEPRTLAQESGLYHFLHNGHPLQREEALTLAKEDGYGSRPVQSALWIPLQQEQHPSGFLSVQSYEPNAYSDSDVQLLRSIATQAGLAISNAQLFQQTQANVAELRLLFSITQAAASSVDAQNRIDNIADALHERLHGANVAILILDEAKHTLDALATRGPTAAGTNFNEGLTRQVADIGQPLLMNDLREVPAFLENTPGVLAQLAVPLNLGQRTIGVISVASPEAGAFSQRDLRLLETLSVSLAATIESSRLFEEIQAANERLRELDRIKTQFLANMSHELRTPLNSIIGFSRVILKGIDGPITSQQEEDLTSIYQSGQHLLFLINDILDLAKIEAGKMALTFESIDMGALANSVQATVRGLLKDKPIKLHWAVAPDLPPIDGDMVRLRQIMINLLSNAAKYTQEGHIWCRVYGDGKAHVHIEVEDTGIGIDAEDYDKLFASFEQVDASPTRAVEGTGLGLPITKSLVEMHQGQIWFESRVGEGTTFHVRLPVERREGAAEEADGVETAPAGQADPPPAQDNGRPAILIVDDEPGIIGLYERYLRDRPFRLLTAHSGRAALDALEQHLAQIQLVLLDINMDGMSGWDVLGAMRDNPDMADIPVVICSIENASQKSTDMGAQRHLPKPIIEDDLLNAVDQVV